MEDVKPSFSFDKLSESVSKSEASDINKVQQEKNIGFLHIFTFASKWDIVLMSIGCISSIVKGPVQFIFGLFMLNLINVFVAGNSSDSINGMMNNGTLNGTNHDCNYNPQILFGDTLTTIQEESIRYAVRVTILCIISFSLDFLSVSCLNRAASNQIYRMRSAYLKAILRQDIGWHDGLGQKDLTSQMEENLTRIKDAISEKMGFFLWHCSLVLSNLIGLPFFGWRLALVAMIFIPIIAFAGSFLVKIQTTMIGKESEIYSEAGGLAEEVIGAVKVVKSFNAQEEELNRFKTALRPLMASGIKRGSLTGLAGGLIWILTLSLFSLIAWYGTRLVLESCMSGEQYSAGYLNHILCSTLGTAFKIGSILPFFSVFSLARAAANDVFKILKRKVVIDGSSTEGGHPEVIEGNIRFRRVSFNYPSRSKVTVLKEIDFDIGAGQTVAIVGHSGCGKSTCIQLIQRFYDPQQGRIELDGCDIKDLNVRWLRNHIGIVGQEPVLFSTTIAENIRFGCTNASQEDIEKAARLANAHDFIRLLPFGYQTQVGQKGTQLSGGQKQRIAIARALIRNPKILLFDEATSALDSSNEAAVQQALNQVRRNRTTIIVAHRLSSIQNADQILLLNNGEIKERGNHSELMDKKGLYYQLFTSQVHDSNLPGDGSEVSSIKQRESISKALRKDTSNDESQNLIVEPEKDVNYSNSLLTLLLLNSSQWHLLFCATIGSLLVGLSSPINAFLYGELMGTFGESSEYEIRRNSDIVALQFLALAIMTGLGSFLETFLFTLTGERLAYKLRSLSFETILSMRIEWFDRPENSVGSLCSQLQCDATAIRDASGSRIGLLVQAIIAISVSIIIALCLSWKLALAGIAFVPIVLWAGFENAKMANDSSLDTRPATQRSTQMTSEAVANIRTVVSLGLEDTIHDVYMKGHEPEILKKNLGRGLLYSFGSNAPFPATIVTCCYGSYLVETENMPYKLVLVVNQALVFGLYVFGETLAFTSNYKQAGDAISRILRLVSHKNKLEGKWSSLSSNKLNGKVEFDDVSFSYPARSKLPVLRNFSASVLSGRNVAIVGQSGCGKSTCVQLLQRFYSPNSGDIRLDDQNIDKISMDLLCTSLGVVSQEPVLFNRTIEENIAYGFNDGKISDVVEAARKANIHNFIQSLPSGYKTLAGKGGLQLSGGEKQRVAIARALIRNPSILVLDEATSALDAESEKIVQDALDGARKGRTVITIAHRLSTIQDSDEILVMDHGRVIERGDHSTLLRRRDLYYKLWTSSTKNI